MPGGRGRKAGRADNLSDQVGHIRPDRLVRRTALRAASRQITRQTKMSVSLRVRPATRYTEHILPSGNGLDVLRVSAITIGPTVHSHGRRDPGTGVRRPGVDAS
jgi:hypothetical protein